MKNRRRVIMEAIVEGKVAQLKINGVRREVMVYPNETLLDVLREKLNLTGVKNGCSNGDCGACTVLIDGRPMTSCLLLAIECEGKDILTIEGLADPKTGELSPIQKAFIDNHAVQCGFCTPGIILTAKALIDNNPSPTKEEIMEAINGHICRCTGYVSIIKAISAAAESMKRAGG
jgi:carbon-monoxide dehydrogenase small subunit